MQEAYPFTVKPKGEAKDKWDFIALGAARSRGERAAGSPHPTKEQNPCTL